MAFVRWTVVVFSLVLALAGAAPLIAPGPSPTSSAPPYAWFHLVAAGVGLASALGFRGLGAAGFALGFGAVDLYQWVASLAGWFPRAFFLWTPVDDALHLGLGLGLVALGTAGVLLRRSR